MYAQRQPIKKVSPLETHRDVLLLGLREQSAQCRVLGAIGCHADQSQFLAGGERLCHRVYAVDEVVEVHPLAPALRASARDDVGMGATFHGVPTYGAPTMLQVVPS